MSPMRIIILVVAAVSAIGLAFVVRGLSGGKSEAVAAPVVEKPMAKVLVAGRDLAVGARITPQDLEWQQWPLEAVNEAYITDGSVALPQKVKTEEEIDAEKAAEKDRLEQVEADAARAERKAKKDGKTPAEIKAAGDKIRAAGKAATPGAAALVGGEAEAQARDVAGRAQQMFGGGGPMEALTGSVVREVFLKGEPITDRKLVRAGDAGVMAVTLNPGMRAMSIPVSVESAAGGFILPGDRVDVVLSRQVQTGGSSTNSEFRAETVMRNVKVLAIDQTLKAEDGAQSVVGATATLEVGAADSEALALADVQGDLALVLRSYADVGGPSGKTARPDLLRGNAQAEATSTVRVWRDGQATSVAVN